MADITLTIPDAQLARVVNGAAAAWGYEPQIRDPANRANTIPNPQSKGAFVKQMVIQVLIAAMRQGEEEAAKAAAVAGLPGAPPIT